MTDQLHARLAESQRVIEAATEGPWEWRGGGWSNDLVKRVFIGDPNSEDFAERMSAEVHPHNILKTVSDWRGTEEDRAFIAAARTELPRLNAALRAVLEVHKLDDQEECAVCVNQEGDPRPWPCPTVRTIQEAMSSEPHQAI